MRTLTLKKETLAELTADELTRVVGAAPTIKDQCQGPTLSLICAWSEVDTCPTGMGC